VATATVTQQLGDRGGERAGCAGMTSASAAEELKPHWRHQLGPGSLRAALAAPAAALDGRLVLDAVQLLAELCGR